MHARLIIIHAPWHRCVWKQSAASGSCSKWLLIIAFFVLPVRGVLYVFSTNAIYLVSIQILDGVAAGIFGVVSILVIADLMKNPGRSVFAQGILATVVGLGASLSNLVTGFIVDAAGFKAGFVSLSALAVVALILLWVAMPETLNNEAGKPAAT